MNRFHPKQIEQARRQVVIHDPQVSPQLRRASRMVQWLILRESRPAAVAPQGEIVAFRRPAPYWPPLDPLHPHGGDAA